jgi:hypothetical protein
LYFIISYGSRSVHSANALYPFVFVTVDFFFPEPVVFWVLSWCPDIFCSKKKCVFRGFSQKISSLLLWLWMSRSFSVQVSLPHRTVGTVGVLHIRHLVCFWTSESFKTRLMIPVINDPAGIIQWSRDLKSFTTAKMWISEEPIAFIFRIYT